MTLIYRQILSAVHRKEAATLRVSPTPQMQVQTPWPATGPVTIWCLRQALRSPRTFLSRTVRQ